MDYFRRKSEFTQIDVMNSTTIWTVSTSFPSFNFMAHRYV